MRNAKLLLLTAILGVPGVSQIGFAQMDPTGEWAPQFDEDFLERIPGPDIGDYLGLPIDNAARLRGDSWDASLLTLPENQCRPHPSDYAWRGPANLRIWKEVDHDTQKLIAYHTHISWQAPERTIWMDGRPHPPAWAAHTWMGFSTGKWEGNILTVYTTHIKQGWVRRNGLPESDQATLVEHFIRHGEHMTHVSIVTDPVYLTEPLVKSEDYLINSNAGGNWLYPCEEVEEVEGRPRGAVPNYLPGQNPFITEYANMYHLPLVAALGGPETMYPEFEKVIKNPPPVPSDPFQKDEVVPMALKNEAQEGATRDELFAELESSLTRAASRIRAIDATRLNETRAVGMKKLPTTLGGLLVHVADHTQRHAGQAITTAKFVRVLSKS